MATLSNGRLTLADISKLSTPDGRPSAIAELLSMQNMVLEDIVLREANQATSHVETVRTGLPDVYFRAYNAGVPSSKSAVANITEPLAMMEARSNIDAAKLALNGGGNDVRLSEESAFVEAMNQAMTATIFNGNVGVDPKSFTGLATRYSDVTAGNATNILRVGAGVNGAATGSDNASMYLVCWSENTVFGVYPKGSTGGLRSRDLGEETVNDSDGNAFQALRSLFQWDMGLVVKDWRSVVRIANIDVSDWVSATGTQAVGAATNLIDAMMKAIVRLPTTASQGRCAFYCNRSILEGLMIQGRRNTTSVLDVQKGLSQFGQEYNMLTFMGYPIRVVDALSTSELGI